ncbi:gluconokinase [bacterium]|nr:gluconokinase [Akkermansiaceae bacterium]MDA7534023.1 gluconokinase [bacterium]MDA7529049.1 gluconokinase [Akkermansiaceae bacterium]MDA7531674.1 gluconokinase [Akkermansiaceae bacterium]MDA7611443.1 gluconokinase [bacterium]
MKSLVIMGVSGSGKTTVGKLLAQKTGGRFLDGDDFHPPKNVAKMSSGIPLTDEDRQGWLETLASIIHEADDLTIIACSALKASYREILKEAEFIFLHGSPELLADRINQRSGHYMPPGLLQSQLETLEVPTNVLALNVVESPQTLVEQIMAHFNL